MRLSLLFALGLFFAALNLHLFTRGALWLASGIASLDLTGWGAVLSLANPPYAVLVLAGASILVEPLWLAALTAHVERVRARSTGDDLRRWFAELRAAA